VVRPAPPSGRHQIFDAVFGVTLCGQGWVSADVFQKTLDVSSDGANARLWMVGLGAATWTY
jgi:hypothetical protein